MFRQLHRHIQKKKKTPILGKCPFIRSNSLFGYKLELGAPLTLQVKRVPPPLPWLVLGGWDVAWVLNDGVAFCATCQVLG